MSCSLCLSGYVCLRWFSVLFAIWCSMAALVLFDDGAWSMHRCGAVGSYRSGGFGRHSWSWCVAKQCPLTYPCGFEFVCSRAQAWSLDQQRLLWQVRCLVNLLACLSKFSFSLVFPFRTYGLGERFWPRRCCWCVGAPEARHAPAHA